MDEIIGISINSYKGEIFGKVYPDFAVKYLLKELRNIFSEICYSPVWNSEPPTVEAWRTLKYNKERLRWLYNNSEILLPGTHHKLKVLFAGAQSTLGLNEIAQILIDARDELYPLLTEAGKKLEKTELICNQSFQSWQSKMSGSPELKLIEGFKEEINRNKPEGLKAVLLHGSFADGMIAPGFSDLDLHYVICMPKESIKLIELMAWIFQSNNYLLSYNPFMHHGPMLVFEEELLAASESVFPSILVEKGIWISGKVENVFYSPGDYENIANFYVFKNFFENNFPESDSIKNIFDALWWTSTVFFLPLLMSQMISRKSMWKRDVLTEKLYVPVEFRNLLDRAGEVRENISLYVKERMTLPLQIKNKNSNPGLILKEYKRKMKLTREDVADLGIDNELLLNAREYYKYCEKTALQLNEQNFSDKGYSFRNVNENWIKGVCEIPNGIPLSEYDEVRAEFLKRCSMNQNVVAVYEFGNVGCPGLSDLDFLVVLSDAYFGIPAELTIGRMDIAHADIMNHDPLFISESEIEIFGMLSPIFNCRQVYGRQINIPTSDTFNRDLQEICYTIQNLVKYPTDLIWLSKQEKIRWKTILAFLNSFNHVNKTLLVSTDKIPDSILKCTELNRKIRTKFINGYCSIEDLNDAFELMIDASIDMVEVYQKVWEKNIPELKEFRSKDGIEGYKNHLRASLKNKAAVFPDLPPGLKIILDTLLAKPLIPGISESLLMEIDKSLDAFQTAREGFIKRELGKGREISYYIAGPAQLDSYRKSIENTTRMLGNGKGNEINTPVLFLIYNRPDLTLQVFERIKKAKPAKLYVAADGPKTDNPEDHRRCLLTRQIVLGVDWNCEVTTLFRETNLGCKRAVSSAIDWFFEKEEAGIIIEDDILAETDFFRFCEEMLVKYADDNRIMHVAGNNLQFGWRRNDYSYYFSYYGSIWGWATWRRAWKLYDVEMKKYPKFLAEGQLSSLFTDEEEIRFRKSTFDEVYFRGMDTWDFQWTFARLNNSGLSIVPSVNLIKNIGFLNDATHTKDLNDKRANLQIEKMNFPLIAPDFVVRDKVSDDRYYNSVIKGDTNILHTGTIISFSDEELNHLLIKSELALGNNETHLAKELLELILSQEPHNIDALNNLAVIFITDDNFEAAGHVLNIILEIDPQNEVALENYKILQSIIGTDNSARALILSGEEPQDLNMLGAPVKKIVWLRTDSIGDNILAGSMLEYLKEFFTNSEITVVCQNHIKELYEFCPHINSAIGFDKMRMVTDIDYKKSVFDTINEINADLFINSVFSSEQLTHEFVQASSAAIRIGFFGDLSNLTEEKRHEGHSYYTHLIRTATGNIPEIRKYEEFLASLGILNKKLTPKVWLSDEDEKFADNFYKMNKLTSGSTIVLFAGAQHAHRVYENYGAALAAIPELQKFSIVVMGDSKDTAVNQRNIDALKSRVINLTGTTSLRQSAAVIKKCRLAVGAETSLAHIACAVDAANVILVGGGHFGRFMPYFSKTSLVCLPLDCFGCNWICRYESAHCVKEIDPDVLSRAITESLTRRSKRPRIFIQKNAFTQEQFKEWLDVSKIESGVNLIPTGNSIITKYEDFAVSKTTNKNEEQISLVAAELEIEKGNLALAKEILEKLLADDSNDTLALNDLAVVNILNREYNEALNILVKILGIDPENEVARGNVEYLASNSLISEEPVSELENKGAFINTEENNELELQRLQSNWNTFGEKDPMWAILTDPSKKNNGWQPGEFFETGINDINRIIEYTGKHNLQLKFGRAMDFGCGIGRLSQALAMKFDEVYGIDIAPSMIETANYHNRFGKKCSYILNSRNDLGFFPDSHLDFIYTIITLQHMKTKYSKNFIKEFLRILKPGGVLIFQVPSKKVDQVYIPGSEDEFDTVQSFDPASPVMEMHGIYKEVVLDILNGNKGEIIDIQDDRSLGADWESFRYCVRKR